MRSFGHQPHEVVSSNYIVEEDPSGHAKCRMCNVKILKGSIRMGKLSMLYINRRNANNIGYQYFHVKCLFKKLHHCRLTTQVLESIEEVAGAETLAPTVKADIEANIEELRRTRQGKVAAASSTRKTNVRKGRALTVTDSAAPQIAEKPAKSENSSSTKELERQKLRFLYTNADILTLDKRNQLNNLIKAERPDIIAITEVTPKMGSYAVTDYQIPNTRLSYHATDYQISNT